MSQRDDDLRVLNELLGSGAPNAEMTDVEVEAFASMRFDLTAYHDDYRQDQLTEKQRAWVTSVHKRLVPQYANLVSQGLVPRGREVPTPKVLQDLPKRPPPLPKPVAGPARVSRRHCGRADEGCYAFVNGDCSCECCR